MIKMLSFNSLSGSVPEIALPTLQSIAVQCPLAGGPAVYTARSLYAPFDDQMVFDDVATCFESGYAFRPAPQQSQPEAVGLSLHPNPALSEVTISVPNEFVGEVKLITPTGTVIKMIPVNDKTVFTLSLQDLPAGVYTCAAKSTTGVTFTAKLVVLP